jgi:hypothetical protein
MRESVVTQFAKCMGLKILKLWSRPLIMPAQLTRIDQQVEQHPSVQVEAFLPLTQLPCLQCLTNRIWSLCSIHAPYSVF